MSVDGIPFNAPATRPRVARLLARLEVGASGRVLDVGCGRGEMLVMLSETSGCEGVGVDPKDEELAIARSRSIASVRLTWHCAEIADIDPGDFDAAICVGASHAYGPPGEALGQTLVELAALLRPGGRLLIGEGYWRRPPPPEYLQATGLQATNLLDHRANAELGEARGLTLLHDEVSSQEEWDEFEGAFLRAAEERLAEAPSDAEAIERHAHWRDWNAAYRRWGRDTLGFGFYVFGRGSG